MFACTRKERLTARNGSGYLSLELRDRTGTITARAFREADFLAGQFDRGDLVWVIGRVERFRDELQIELAAIRRVDADEGLDPAEFLPSAYRDLEELDGFLEHLAREVYDPDYKRLLDSFLGDDSFRAELRLAPCTRAGHHAYLGGLLEHTVAVATLAQETCVLHPRLNSDLLMQRRSPPRRGQDARVRASVQTIGPSEEGRLDGTRGAGAAEWWRSTAPACPTSPRTGRSRSRTASSPTTGRTECRRHASARPRRSRSTA